MDESKQLDNSILIKRLAENGITAEQISSYTQIPYDDLIDKYGYILRTAMIDKVMRIADNLFEMALSGNIQANIFWLKSLGKWDELSKIIDDIKPLEKIQNIEVSILSEEDIENIKNKGD